MNDCYDIILIGSGMGALTVASLMAQLRDKRVLVLEKHIRPGGTPTILRGAGSTSTPASTILAKCRRA